MFYRALANQCQPNLYIVEGGEGGGMRSSQQLTMDPRARHLSMFTRHALVLVTAMAPLHSAGTYAPDNKTGIIYGGDRH